MWWSVIQLVRRSVGACWLWESQRKTPLRGQCSRHSPSSGHGCPPETQTSFMGLEKVWLLFCMYRSKDSGLSLCGVPPFILTGTTILYHAIMMILRARTYHGLSAEKLLATRRLRLVRQDWRDGALARFGPRRDWF